MSNEQKLQEIRNKFADDANKARESNVLHAAYLNLTNENANLAEEVVRQTVIGLADAGMLDVAAKYLSDAQKVQSLAKDDTKK